MWSRDPGPGSGSVVRGGFRRAGGHRHGCGEWKPAPELPRDLKSLPLGVAADDGIVGERDLEFAKDVEVAVPAGLDADFLGGNVPVSQHAFFDDLFRIESRRQRQADLDSTIGLAD